MPNKLKMEYDGKVVRLTAGFTSVEDIVTFVNTLAGQALTQFGYHLEVVKNKEEKTKQSKVTRQ